MPNEKVFLDAFGGPMEPHQTSPYMVCDQWVEVSHTADHGGYKFIAYPRHILPHILSLQTPTIVLQT